MLENVTESHWPVRVGVGSTVITRPISEFHYKGYRFEFTPKIITCSLLLIILQRSIRLQTTRRWEEVRVVHISYDK